MGFLSLTIAFSGSEVRYPTEVTVSSRGRLTGLILVAVIFVIIAPPARLGGDSWIAGLVFLLIALPCLAGSSFPLTACGNRMAMDLGRKRKGGHLCWNLARSRSKQTHARFIEVQNPASC